MNAEQSPPYPPSRAWRLPLGLTWTILAVVVGFVSYASAPYEEIFRQLEMTDLPAPTEAMLAMCRFFRSPIGIAAGAIAYAAGLVLLRLGVFDRSPVRNILLLVAAILVLGAGFHLGLRLPILKIEDQLKRQGMMPASPAIARAAGER